MRKTRKRVINAKLFTFAAHLSSSILPKLPRTELTDNAIGWKFVNGQFIGTECKHWKLQSISVSPANYILLDSEMV